MSTAQELERLVVRLVGEGSDYERVLDEAIAATEQAAKKIGALTEQEMAEQNSAMEQAARITRAVATPTERYAQELAKLERLYKAGHISQKTYNRATKEAANNLPSVRAAQAAYNAELKRAKAITAAARTPAEQYRRKLAELERLHKKGMISIETHARAIRKLNREYSHGRAAARKYGNELTSVGRKIRNVGAMLTLALVVPLAAATLAMISASAEIIKVSTQFEVLLGSASKAEALIGEMIEFAAATPFLFPGIAESGRSLLAFGIAQEDLMETIRMLGDVSAGTGKDLKELGIIFGQIRGLGHLNARDFLQLINAGFDVSEIAKTMGVDMGTLRVMMERTQVPFSAVEETFRRVTAEGGLYHNMLYKLSQTPLGLWSTLKDNIFLVAKAFGDELMPIVKAFVRTSTDLAKWAQKIPSGWKRVILVIMGLVAALVLAVTAAGTLVMVVGLVTTTWAALPATIATVTAALGTVTAAMATFVSTAITLAVAIGWWLAPLVAVIAGLVALNYYLGTFDSFAYDKGKDTGKKYGEGFTDGVKDVEFDPIADQLRVDIAKLEIAMEKQVATLGMHGNALKIWELKRRDATDAQLEAVRALDKEFAMKQLTLDVHEFNKSLIRQEQTLGKSSNAIKLWDLKARGAGKEALDFARESVKYLEEKQLRFDIGDLNLALEEQVRMFGKSGTALKIRALEVRNASDTELEFARSMEKTLAFMESKKLITKMKEEAETFGMTTRARALYRMEQEFGITAASREGRKLDKELTAKKKEADLYKESLRLIKQLRTPIQKFKDEKNRLLEMWDKELLTIEQFNKAMTKLVEQHRKEIAIKVRVDGLDAAIGGTVEAEARLEKFVASLKKMKPIRVPHPDLWPRKQPDMGDMGRVAAVGGGDGLGAKGQNGADAVKEIEVGIDLIKAIEEHVRPRDDQVVLKAPGLGV